MNNKRAIIGLLAVTAWLFAAFVSSCSEYQTTAELDEMLSAANNSGKTTETDEDDTTVVAPQPVRFTVDGESLTRLAHESLTRFAGGDQTEATIKQQGFGVMAYRYAADGSYNAASSVPSFMRNQPVFWNGTEWEYTPQKYWPQADKVTIFAYAPWNDPAIAPADGSLFPLKPSLYEAADDATDEYVAGDPKVYYRKFRTKVSDLDGLADSPLTFHDIHENEATDLLWATPMTDKTKLGLGESINLTFNHALARLGFKVKKDGGIAGTVVIRELQLTGNFYREGVLNLNGGVWTLDPATKRSETYVFHLNQTVTTTALPIADAIPLLMLPQDFSADDDAKIRIIYTIDEDWHSGITITLKEMLSGLAEDTHCLVQGKTTWITLNINPTT